MKCRVCDGSDFELVVDLKDQPLALNFLTKEEVGKELFYPLRVVVCLRCKTAQLDYTIKKEVVYSKHTYLSGITRSLYDHFYKTAKDVDDHFFSNKFPKSVLDIGSNDGTQLKCYQKLGYEVLGVEPSSNIAKIANESGVNTFNAFYNLETAKEINQSFDVINASGVFFHLEELHSVTAGIKKYLKDNGVFVVQFLYMRKIMENVAFDQIYHEHLLYYNVETLNYLLNIHGLEVFDAKLSPIHGGSIIAYVSHIGRRQKSDSLNQLLKEERNTRANELETYYTFAKNIEMVKLKNLAFLERCKKENKKVFGMGAPVKGNTLLNYLNIDNRYIECLVEKNELRKNLFSPGMHLPILIEKELKQLPDVYFVLAWNFKEEILKNNDHLIKKGIEFYFPINPGVVQ